MPPKFIYFDLGNVLLNFDHELACRQMADVSGVSVDAVRDFVFGDDNGIQWRYERGEVSTAEFHRAYCDAFESDVSVDDLARAASDIFRVNAGILPLLSQLSRYGHRLGILSNTCAAHWAFVSDGRYRLVREYFERFALSYELRSMKPAKECFQGAADLAGVPGEEILFIDDRQDNVAGALAAGWSAVSFTSTAALARDLRSAGISLLC